jgi:Mrp family chromosome partitioning ATPase
VARRNVSKPDWIGAVKAGVENWKSIVQSQISQPGTDLEALAREEGIKLVQRVFHRTGQDGPRVAIFSGLENGPGSASICIRAAEVLAARREGPVCVVDADFGSPSLHQRFGVENINGLSEATLGSNPIEQFIQHIPERDLWLMPTGKAFTQVTLSGIEEGLRTRIAELRAAFRFVIIHAGTLRLESSAMQLSGWTDGIVLVVEANSTRRELVKRMKEYLLSSKVNLLGVVLNNRTFPIPEAIYRRL